MSRLGRALAALARRRVLFACTAEAAFLAIAALVAWVAGIPFLADLHWDARDLAIGTGAALPMLAVPWWVMHSRLPAIVRLRALVEHRLLDYFRDWSVRDLVLLSAIAGLSEEVLFRAVLQGGLAGVVGPLPALALASVVFGAFHPITVAYAAIAAAIGVYLGALWLLSGNLLAPIAAHALYDALVLVVMVRVGPGR